MIIKSTVPVGYTQKVREMFDTENIIFSPEFLREGSSIKDYDNPPYTVVGGDSQKSVDAVHEIFSHLPCEFFSTSIRTAEMLKYGGNL